MEDNNSIHHTLGAIEAQLRSNNDNLSALRADVKATQARDEERHLALEHRVRKVEGDTVRIHTITVVISGVVSFIVMLATTLGSLILRIFGK